MKNTILAVLMIVMVATPCLAQQVETDGLFSIEGTLWKVCRMGIDITNGEPNLYPLTCNTMGFDQGTVYWCDENGNECFSVSMSYINTPVVSIAYEIRIGYRDLYVMQPTAGIGFAYYLQWGVASCIPKPGTGCPRFFSNLIGIMFKVDNNWAPLEVE